VSFDIDANGLLQVSAMDRTTGRQQSVSIQGGSNLSEEEIARLIEEAEQKAAEDRRKRAAIDRRNRALTLVAQAERRLRDASLELGPYGAERQQRAVEMTLRDVQDLLALEERGDSDPGELDLAVSQLQEALFGLNRRLLSERKADQGPLQGLKNTLGSLKDELFADDDDWDDWSRPASDPWSRQADWSRQGDWSRSPDDRWGPERQASSERRYGQERFSPLDRDPVGPESDRAPYGRFAVDESDDAAVDRYAPVDRDAPDDRFVQDDRYDRFAESAVRPAPVRPPRRSPDLRPADDDPWAER
jgi:molecular chaperone DnaK